MSVSADLNAIPPQLRYGASQSVCRVQRINNIRPLGSDSGSASSGDSFRFDFPSRQLINLSSLQLFFTATVEGMTTAADGTQCAIPASWKMFRRVIFYIGNTAVSGALSSHHHQLYNALCAATGNTEWLYSRANKNAIEFLLPADENDLGAIHPHNASATTTSRSAFLVADDFLGLPRSRNTVIDQSLWGQLSVQVELADNSILRIRKTGAGSTDAMAAAVSYRVSGMRASVEVIESVPPQYISLLSARLSQTDQPIRLPFMDYRTQIVSNTGSVRTAVNTNCLDGVLVCPLTSAYNTVAGVAIGTPAPAFQHNTGRNLLNADQLKCQLQVGASSYPRSQVENALEALEITMDSWHGASREGTALLYASAITDDVTIGYRKLNALTKNFQFYTRLSLNGAGYQDGHLTGVSTNGAGMDVVFNSQNFTQANGFVFVAHLVTSCLVFSPATSSVSVEQ